MRRIEKLEVEEVFKGQFQRRFTGPVNGIWITRFLVDAYLSHMLIDPIKLSSVYW